MTAALMRPVEITTENQGCVVTFGGGANNNITVPAGVYCNVMGAITALETAINTASADKVRRSVNGRAATPKV